MSIATLPHNSHAVAPEKERQTGAGAASFPASLSLN